ncbi:ThiF family adenylyltransferase [Pantoea sp. Aalb]|uniref:ThiF family adenylyltransferase n=1 Tax=Pantoea sp. Aalb TaxID=2576762 RepID=UPI0013276205|nr:ThiF family adenylyltransferase [Pantoea sp. Aalb]MXP67994.1 HesA/MoeB/ThiF family protein [Pantoea sp. Aalb]
MERYHRQIILSEIGHVGQRIIKQARVLVVGVGGLSSTLLMQLVGSGIGYIRLYDKDVVSLHNLHRQTLFTINDIGYSKVACAKRTLKKYNPDVKIDAIQKLVTASILDHALKNIDIVIDAADNFVITYLLSDACHKHLIPLISASVLGRCGYVGGFCYNAPSYRAVFPFFPTSITNCNIFGVMGPAVATLGALQAQMVISVLLGLLPSPLGCIINCDFINWHFHKFRFDSASEPKQPTIPFIDRQLISQDDCVIELRSYKEAPVSIINDVERISPQEIYAWQPPNNRRIILICASGIRAANAALILEKRGFSFLAILAANYS